MDLPPGRHRIGKQRPEWEGSMLKDKLITHGGVRP